MACRVSGYLLRPRFMRANLACVISRHHISALHTRVLSRHQQTAIIASQRFCQIAYWSRLRSQQAAFISNLIKRRLNIYRNIIINRVTKIPIMLSIFKCSWTDISIVTRSTKKVNFARRQKVSRATRNNLLQKVGFVPPEKMGAKNLYTFVCFFDVFET